MQAKVSEKYWWLGILLSVRAYACLCILSKEKEATRCHRRATANITTNYHLRSCWATISALSRKLKLEIVIYL